MESPPADDGFEHVDYQDYLAWSTDDEYEFVEAPPVVERSTAPPAAHGQPIVGGGVGSVYEDDDGGGSGGDDDQAFSPPGPETTIIGCDQDGFPTNTIVQVMPPHGAVAPGEKSSPTKAHAEEEKMASPFSPSCGVAAPVQDDAAMMQAARRDQLVQTWDVSELFAVPAARGKGAGVNEAEEDEATDDDEYDGLYGYYDFADFGRARRVKRSSGRRGRTKKATSMGRPRGEERLSHIAGNY